MLVKEENFPQTDTTVVLKEDAALDAVKDVVFFMTTSIMIKRSWKLAVMHDLYSWIMKQTVSV